MVTILADDKEAARKAAKKAGESKATPDTGADATGDLLRLTEFIDQITVASGTRKHIARPVIEATLALLGKTLANEREFNLPPLGRARVNKKKEQGEGAVLIIKLKQGPLKAGKKDAAEGLADPEE